MASPDDAPADKHSQHEADCWCCEPPASLTVFAAFDGQTRAVSRSKLGFAEFGTPSTPPRRYLKKDETVEAVVDRTLKKECDACWDDPIEPAWIYDWRWDRGASFGDTREVNPATGSQTVTYFGTAHQDDTHIRTWHSINHDAVDPPPHCWESYTCTETFTRSMTRNASTGLWTGSAGQTRSCQAHNDGFCHNPGPCSPINTSTSPTNQASHGVGLICTTPLTTTTETPTLRIRENEVTTPPGFNCEFIDGDTEQNDYLCSYTITEELSDENTTAMVAAAAVEALAAASWQGGVPTSLLCASADELTVFARESRARISLSYAGQEPPAFCRVRWDEHEDDACSGSLVPGTALCDDEGSKVDQHQLFVTPDQWTGSPGAWTFLGDYVDLPPPALGNRRRWCNLRVDTRP